MPQKFKLKTSEAMSRAISIVAMAVLGLFLLISTIVGLSSGTVGTSALLILLSLFMIGFAVYEVRSGMTPGAFVMLTDEGINVSNKTRIPWDAVESVQEEQFARRSRYRTIEKQRVRVRYFDQARNKSVDNTAIVSDYEGYPTLRDQIMKEAKERPSGRYLTTDTQQ